MCSCIKLLVFTCSPVGLAVGLILDAFKALVLQGGGNGNTKVGDGVCPVLQVETVARGVQPVDGCQSVKMILPRLVGIEGVDTSSDTPWHVIYCQRK